MDDYTINSIKEALCVLRDLKSHADDHKIAYSLAEGIVALEKQTPKVPNEVTYLPLKTVGWQHCCPNCNYAVGINSNSFDYTEEDNYCGRCGQRLDWKRQ